MTHRHYTHPGVLTEGVTQGWADPETDPALIDWPARQAAAAIPFAVTGGRPVNPCAVTAVRHGRNQLGRWGENAMADALVTVTCGGQRWLLMVERGDGLGWAVPGGTVEPGETGVQAAVRELAEETGLAVPADACQAGDPLYVPDPRASDEAWAVTIPVRADLGPLAGLPFVTGADDARRAEWIRAGTYDQLVTSLSQGYGGQVFAAHTGMLRLLLGPALLPDVAAERAQTASAGLPALPAGDAPHGPVPVAQETRGRR
jgi:ADP-ribose pyrophosphatase